MGSSGKKKNQEGAALIFVMCISFVFLALALIMMFASYQVVRTAQTSAQQEQCRQSAVTFNQALSAEITSTQGADTNSTELENIRDYICHEIASGNWTYYNADEMGHGKLNAYRNLDIGLDGSLEENTGELSVTAWWESEEDSDFDDIVFVTEVTCELDEETYKVRTQYELQKDENGEVPDTWIWGITWQGL